MEGLKVRYLFVFENTVYQPFIVDGKEITPINDAQIKEQCDIIRTKDIRNIVIVGVFSPLASKGTQEEYVKQVIENTLSELNVNIVCSKDGMISWPCTNRISTKMSDKQWAI